MGGYRELVDFLVELIRVSVTRLPRDVYEALLAARAREDNPVARRQLDAMIRNAELAARLGRPVCQDTGAPYFLFRVGVDYPLRGRLLEAAEEAVRRATREVPLRPNTVDPLRRRNPGDNTGRYMPQVDVELVPGDSLEATYAPKGGGSEQPTRVTVASPLEARRALAETVLGAVVDAGPRPCPPVIIGVGIAATGEHALRIAKKQAALRPLGTRNPDPEAARLEEKLLEAVNSLEIGPHGFGGRTTALAVHLDYAYRHPATFAIGVVFSCWATRRATGVIGADGGWRITSSHI